MKLRWLLGAVLVVGAGSAAWAVPDTVDSPASPSAAAQRVAAPADLVSISEVSSLSRATELLGARIAAQSGGAALPTRASSVGMQRLIRGAAVVQQPPPGYLIPMGVSAVPVDLAAVIMSQRVAAVIDRGEAVFGQLSASLRGAQEGDVVELVAANGALVSLRVGLVAPDAEVGGTELVVAPPVADLIGIDSSTRIVLWGFDSRAALDAAVAAANIDPLEIRVTRSWDPPSPDSGIGMARTKQLLGEFAYRELSQGVAIEPGWPEANIVTRATLADIGIRVACHRLVQPAVQGAISEIAARGLAGEIDIASTNSVGGCFVPRFNRVTGNLGFLSRHSWGQALDINVSQNPQGAIPRLNCDVVRIFRKWGFAWGGNFTSLDGMHFEYVGEARDQLAYPSRFCPNVTTAVVDRPIPPDESTLRETLFAGDGMTAE